MYLVVWNCPNGGKSVGKEAADAASDSCLFRLRACDWPPVDTARVSPNDAEVKRRTSRLTILAAPCRCRLTFIRNEGPRNPESLTFEIKARTASLYQLTTYSLRWMQLKITGRYARQEHILSKSDFKNYHVSYLWQFKLQNDGRQTVLTGVKISLCFYKCCVIRCRTGCDSQRNNTDLIIPLLCKWCEGIFDRNFVKF